MMSGDEDENASMISLTIHPCGQKITYFYRAPYTTGAWNDDEQSEH